MAQESKQQEEKESDRVYCSFLYRYAYAESKDELYIKESDLNNLNDPDKFLSEHIINTTLAYYLSKSGKRKEHICLLPSWYVVFINNFYKNVNNAKDSKDKQQQIQNINKYTSIFLNEKFKTFLIPYNFNKHWILFVIEKQLDGKYFISELNSLKTFTDPKIISFIKNKILVQQIQPKDTGLNPRISEITSIDVKQQGETNECALHVVMNAYNQIFAEEKDKQVKNTGEVRQLIRKMCMDLAFSTS